MVNIWGISVKIGLEGRTLLGLGYQHQSLKSARLFLLPHSNICHLTAQLKRELGVLKASYIQIAALVGAGEQKVGDQMSASIRMKIRCNCNHISSQCPFCWWVLDWLVFLRYWKLQKYLFIQAEVAKRCREQTQVDWPTLPLSLFSCDYKNNYALADHLF